MVFRRSAVPKAWAAMSTAEINGLVREGAGLAALRRSLSGIAWEDVSEYTARMVARALVTALIVERERAHAELRAGTCNGAAT